MRERLPCGRLVANLCVVALVCAVSALAFRAAPQRRWFRSEAQPRGAPAVE